MKRLLLLAFLMVLAPALAQNVAPQESPEPEPEEQGQPAEVTNQAEEDDTIVRPMAVKGIESFAFLVGAPFGEEQFTFSNIFLDVEWNAIQLPIEGGSSGVALEIYFGDAANSGYSVWNLNRMEIGRLITGFDMQIARDGGDGAGIQADFDKRIVVGGKFGKLGPVEISTLFFFLPDNTPIASGLRYTVPE